jgi:hypothetical protein
MKAIKVDIDDLASAFENAGPESHHYLDTETGEVIFVLDEDRGDVGGFLEECDAEPDDLSVAFEKWLEEACHHDWQRDNLRQVFEIESDYTSRFIEVSSADSREGFQDMEDFTESVENERAQKRLCFALSGPKPFRRFKDALEELPDERERWFAFKADRSKQRVLDWLESEGLQPLPLI